MTESGTAAPQRRRRRRLLLWSAPVVLAVVVVAGLLLTTVFGNLLGRQDYEEMRYPQAAERFESQQGWTGFAEPWRAWFNSGTARYRAEDYVGAAEDLSTALEKVPAAQPLPGAPPESKDPEAPECRVRLNLSLSLEAMGDEATDAREHELASGDYAEAREVLEPCVVMAPDDETSRRQQDKEEQAREDSQGGEQPTEEPTEEPSQQPTEEPTPEPEPSEPDEDPSQDPSEQPEEPTESADPTEDPQREELDERNRDAERERQEQQQRGGGGSGSGQAW